MPDSDDSALVDMVAILRKNPSNAEEILAHLAGLSGSSDGTALLVKNMDVVAPVLSYYYLLTSSKSTNSVAIKTHVCSTICNVLASEGGSVESLVSEIEKDAFIKRMLKDSLTDSDSQEGNVLRVRTATMLANSTACSIRICQAFLDFTNKKSNASLNVLDRMFALSLDIGELGTAFLSAISNLTQISEFRAWLLSLARKTFTQPEPTFRLKLLLPYAAFSPCARRQEAVLAAVKNCCFSTELHEKLVAVDGVNSIPSLLLPIADGSHTFTAEENARLLTELRYLDESVRRTDSAAIRMVVIEALYQLCSTRTGREALRNSGAYLILREYHRWEEETGENSAICDRLFDVIEIIISDEHADDTFDNLHKVEIPEHLRVKFETEKTAVTKV